MAAAHGPFNAYEVPRVGASYRIVGVGVDSQVVYIQLILGWTEDHVPLLGDRVWALRLEGHYPAHRPGQGDPREPAHPPPLQPRWQQMR